MTIVFAGYRKWAFAILKKLLQTNNHPWQITAGITTSTPQFDPTSITLPFLSVDPKTLDNSQFLKQIQKLHPDVLLFYGWSWLIPKEIYQNYLTLALHPSPLPKYRGGSPIQNQIINGEKQSAVTIFKVGEGIDDGDIYAQTAFALDGTLEQILKRIVTVGAKDTRIMLDQLATHTLIPKKQNEKEVTFYKRRKPAQSELTSKDFETKTAEEIYNMIRALGDPYPNAFIRGKDGKKVFLTGAKREDEKKV